jgi:hypothetical protein
MIPAKAIGTAALAVVLAAACERTKRAEPEEASPPRQGTYAFDLYQEGDRLHMLLVEYEPGTEDPYLTYRGSRDGGAVWSEPVRVDGGARPAFVPYRGVDPQLAASGDELVAVWTTAGDDVYGYGTGPLATAISSDGGKTWSAGPNPADDGLTTAHEFIDVMSGSSGRFHLVWIDDRDDDEGMRRGLRYSRSEDGGATWSANQTLDEHICGCCWTHLRKDAAGKLYALYRDEHPDPSDMKLMVSENGGLGWSDLGYVGAFGWMLSGCPHTTAGLAFVDSPEAEGIHALVQTGKEGLGGVYHLRSRDGGSVWTEPSKIADEGAHYSDLAAKGTVLGAVWQGQSGTSTVIYGRLSRDGGRSWSEPRIVSDPAVSSSYPRIAAASPQDEGFRVFWIESKDGAAHRWNGARLGN